MPMTILHKVLITVTIKRKLGQTICTNGTIKQWKQSKYHAFKYAIYMFIK
jgi:hypothetical protein